MIKIKIRKNPQTHSQWPCTVYDTGKAIVSSALSCECQMPSSQGRFQRTWALTGTFEGALCNGGRGVRLAVQN